MKLLLDTHALIWYYQTDPKLSALVRTLIEDPWNDVLVSPASYWEVAIKISTQKPVLQVTFTVFIQEAIFDNNFKILAIEPRHTAIVARLPFDHKDPFDRLLIAQALAEGIPLVSTDAAIDAYGVQRIW